MTLLTLLMFVIVLPLCGFGVLMALGRKLGEPLAGYVGTGFALASFAAAAGAMVHWIGGGPGYGFGVGPLVRSVAWLPVGAYAGQRVPGFLDLTVYVDSLTVVMLAMVTLIAAVVHLYSLRYLRHDPKFATYFGRLSLFGFSMCGLLVSGTLLQMLVFWELVGLCSYLLIGFWDRRRDARFAATKAFIVNRVGDVGFIIGLGLLVGLVGNTTLPDLWATLSPSTQTVTSSLMLTLIGGLLFCGAIGKSAQFPLHTWLPDAMAGPTPVSALIHAATMVAAGVFLLIRIDPILTADARLLVTCVGAITIAIGSLCALAQRDLKQALAYSTMAQLGYMVLGVGVGSRDGAGFHLLTHAFFKALLFLAAGVVIHGMHHKSRLEHFGGLWRRMPVTAVAFAIGGLAMSATPFFSGFYSKELLLGHAAAWSGLAHDSGRWGVWSLALWVPVVAAYVTPFYLARLWMLTFAGPPRDVDAFEHASEPGLMSFPLVLLSGLAVVSGYAWFPVRSMVESSAVETRLVTAAAAGQVNALEHVWPSHADAAIDGDAEDGDVTDVDRRVSAGLAAAGRLTHWAWLAGLLSGVAMYARGFDVTERVSRFAVVRGPREWLRHRMYFDDLYSWVFVGTARLAGKLIDAIDRRVIDSVLNAAAKAYAVAGRGAARIDDAVVDGVVRGVASGVRRGGGVVALSHGGRVRTYVGVALVTVAAAAVGLTVWMALR